MFFGLGVFLEIILRGHVTALSPWTLVSAVVILLLTAAGVRHWADSRVVLWLSGVELAIVSITAVAIVSVSGAVFSDGTMQKMLGIRSVYSCWPFLMAMAVMTANLTAVTSRRAWPLTYKNVCFTLSHLGLLIIILGGAFSATSLQRLRLVINQGADSAVAIAEDGREYPLPFRVRLKEFNLTTFPPTLSLTSLDSKAGRGFIVTPVPGFITGGKVFRVADYRISVEKYYPRAALVGDFWYEVKMKTGAPAAFIRVQDSAGNQIAKGWVSCGSMETNGALVPISSTKAILMPEPSPRSFESQIIIKDASGAHAERVLVNKPLAYDGYQLYQLSYDEKAGAGSNYSVLEVVRDRGLPIVYTGTFMLLVGVALLMWNGVGTPEESGESQ